MKSKKIVYVVTFLLVVLIVSLTMFSANAEELVDLATTASDDSTLSTVANESTVTAEGVYETKTVKEGLASTSAPADIYPLLDDLDTVPNGHFLSWNKIDGAYKYRVFIKNGVDWKGIGDTYGTTFNHTGLTNGTTYIYTVRALDKNGKFYSNYYHDGWAKKYFDAPVMTQVDGYKDGIRIYWNDVNGAEKYRLYRKTASTDWTRIANVTDTHFFDTDIQDGVVYTYTVRCIKADESEFDSHFDRTGKSAIHVPTPKIYETYNLDNATEISWKAVPGATQYRVFIKNGDSWKGLGDTRNTMFTHKGLTNNTTYVYTVRALDKNGNFASGYDEIGTPNKYLSVPTLSQIKPTNNSLKVSWNKVTGAEKYRLYVKSGSSDWKRIVDTTSTSYIDNNVSSGNTYTYTVRCLSADGNTFDSNFSKSGISLMFVSMPKVSYVENTRTGAEISWKKVQGAYKYKVFYKMPDKWKTIGETSSTSFEHKPLTNGAEYTYTVRATDKNGDFISDFDDSGYYNKFIAPPKFTYISYSNGNMILYWNKVNGVPAYRVYRKSYVGDWERLTQDQTEDNSFVDAKYPNDIPYMYTLRCVTKDGDFLSSFPTDNLYYYKGSVANGNIKINGKNIYFNNGKVYKGYITVNGKKYYYNSSGVLMKDTIVGSKSEGYYYADENGVCCTSEEMRLAAEFMMNECEGNTRKEMMKSAFMYMANNFPYRRTYDHPKGASDIPALAIDLFKNERGNCFRYAAGYACVAKIAGYRTRMVIGTTGGNPHGWTEVLVDGEWLICDVDAQLPNYKVPNYYAYMMKNHYWQLTVHTKCELTINSDGKAVWK